MKKYLVISIILAILAIFSGFYFYRKNGPNLALQSQCATQAQKALLNFESENSSNSIRYIDYSEQNHFNSSENKCFVLIDYQQDFSQSPPGEADALSGNLEDLRDAYENADIASCNLYINPATPSTCWNQKGDSITYEQYSKLVKSKMEIQ